jgi:ketosteroid isomerase-like protein
VTEATPTRNVEIVRRRSSALIAGDRDELRELIRDTMHPDCEWVPRVTAVEGRTYRGHEGMLEFVEDFLASFSVRYRVDELRAVGDRAVLFLGAMELRGRESGADVRQEVGVVYEFEDGLMRRGEVFDSRAEALAAAEALHA